MASAQRSGSQGLAGRALLAVVVLAAASAASGFVGPTQSPPGGLDPSNTPMFILFTHDDAIMDTTYDVMRSLTDNRTLSGCPATATMFVATRIGNDCQHTLDLHAAGYEIADHTRSHIPLKGLKHSKLEDELLGARDDLVACGVPEGDIAGARAPYLTSDPAMRQLLSDNGFLYDSSLIEEGTGASLSNGMSARVWPFQMDGGLPMNCAWFGNSEACSESERYPGMWEVPVWQLLDKDGVWSMNYGEDPGASVYKILKSAFDASYTGNRAPRPIFVHTPWLLDHGSDVARFLDEVSDSAAYPNVYMVTIRQLLAWMANPVPADQLTPDALGCGAPGGGPGTGGGGAAAPAGAPAAAPSGQQQEAAPAVTDSPGSAGGSDGEVTTYSATGTLRKPGFNVRRRLL